MARADSLAGTPDPLALPERLTQLETRLAQLEAGIGGGFVLAPDADADGQLNVETNDGNKLQIFPPLVTPQMIEDLWAQVTPETVEFDLNRGKAQLTRVGSRVWIVGQATPINAPGWHNGTNIIGVVPQEFAPTAWQSFPCANEAAHATGTRTTRCDINVAGEIRFYSMPALRVDPHRVPVTVDLRTDQHPGHQHGTSQAPQHNHGNTGSAGDPAHTHTTAAAGAHSHTTPNAGVHSHAVSGTTPHTYDQGAELVPDTAKFPNWVQICATWTIAQPEQGATGGGGGI
ncbi:hypothetical protein AB0J38_14415 [Streptomyces sp. NPDC050095]|uniref:hypothetical protein n=1 Tax=unclassified Streptomyces TaxID=2593676 RepID=UPI003439BA01